MKRLSVLIAAIALIAAGCASDTSPSGADASSDTTTTVTETTTSEASATTTTAPTATTTATAPAGEPASEEDAAAITATYDVVFSSKTTFDDKAPLIDDPTGLEDTIATYNETGETMGGISLAATTITVDGDDAVVTYDLLFADNPTYPNLKGDAVRVGGEWIVTRDMFCAIMTSARVGCPSS